MTSEAIEESGVNVFMSELPRGIGRARWRFESNPAGANEPSDIGLLKPGRRTANSRLQREPRLLFLYDVRSAIRQAGRGVAFWPGVCGKHHQVVLSFRDGPNGSALLRRPMTGSGPDPESRDSGFARFAHAPE